MIEGGLDNVPLTDVLQIVTTGQKSGMLTIESDDALARVYVDRGRIQMAQMEPGPHLGEMMVRLEFLSPEELQGLLEAAPGTDDRRPLGALAVERELVSGEKVRAALRLQAVEVLADLLTWTAGRFIFAERPIRQGDRLPDGGHDAVQLLMAADALRRDLDEGTADPATVYQRADDPTKYDLPEGAWDLLGLLDGRLAARTVVAEADMTEIDGLRVLHRMERLGVIRATAATGSETVVLVLGSEPTLQRLLRLALQRAGMRAELVETPDEAFAGIDRVRPHVILVDGRSIDAGSFVRQLRDTPGRGHLPALVLEDPGAAGGLFARFRKTQATTMSYPFDELELQRTVASLAGRKLL